MLSSKHGFADSHYSLPQFTERKNYKHPDEQQRIEETVSLIPEGISTILDVGCGIGIITNRLISRYKPVGLNLTKEPLAHVEAPKTVGNAAFLPFRDESFDLVLCLEVLEHLPFQIYEKAIEELQRVAKHFVIISVPNQENLDKSFVKCDYSGSIFSESRHIRSFESQCLKNYFPNFSLEALKFCGKVRPRYNKWLIRIRHFFGIWAKTDKAICPLCGNSVHYRKSWVGKILNIILYCLSIPLQLTSLISNPKKQRRWIIALYCKEYLGLSRSHSHVQRPVKTLCRKAAEWSTLASLCIF